MKNVLVKNSMLLYCAILLSLFTSLQAWSQDGLQLGYPIYNGNGCPMNSASVALNEDRSALTILFNDFVVQAGMGSGLSMDRKKCDIAIPVHVPQGYMVSILTIDYRGFVSLPYGGQGRFSAEYFFAGQRGPSATKIFNGGMEDDYIFTNKLSIESMVWSECGMPVTLRVSSGLFVRTNRAFEDAMASVDSADLKSGVVFHLQYKRCYR